MAGGDCKYYDCDLLEGGSVASLHLKFLKKDRFGYYIQIPEYYLEKIDFAQEEFVQMFMSKHKKLSHYAEWSGIDKIDPFVFAPKTVEIMSKEIVPDLMNEVSTLFSKESLESDSMRSFAWKESSIFGVLSKLITYEGYRTERIMADRAADYISKTFNDKVIKIKELCTGAGITTTLVYEALARKNKRVQIHTVDNSMQSIMCAVALFSLRKIPVRIKFNVNAREDDFDGITIYFDSATEAIDKEGTYNFVFSDNGINYFDSMLYKTMVEKMISHLKKRGLLQICSADTSVVSDINAWDVLKESFNKNRIVDDGVGGYDYKTVDNVMYIKKFHTPSAEMEYELIHDMLMKKKLKLLLNYIKVSSVTLSIGNILPQKMKTSLKKTSKITKEYIGLDGDYYPPYENQPCCLVRLFELKLPKKDGTD
ncbi:hypothetical protein J6Z48_00395 [bacterium]|nr:hypothetical protein [bacterium]